MPKVGVWLGVSMNPWMPQKSNVHISSNSCPIALKILWQTQFWLLFLLASSKLQDAQVRFPRFSRDPLENTRISRQPIFDFDYQGLQPIWSCVYPEIFSLFPLLGIVKEKYQFILNHGADTTWEPSTIIFVILPKKSFLAWKFQVWHNFMWATISNGRNRTVVPWVLRIFRERLKNQTVFGKTVLKFHYWRW